MIGSQLTDQIIAYEQDQLTDEEIIAFFQVLVDTGMAWSLQGHYGRMAKVLIEAGAVKTKGQVDV
jgi:hypothetical protein